MTPRAVVKATDIGWRLEDWLWFHFPPYREYRLWRIRRNVRLIPLAVWA